MLKKVIEDNNNVSNRFVFLNKIKNLIKDPFEKSINIYRSFIKYLKAIYEISNSGNDITSRALMNYLGFTNTTIYTFFKRNDIIKKYINIKIGLAGWNGANYQ